MDKVKCFRIDIKICMIEKKLLIELREENYSFKRLNKIFDFVVVNINNMRMHDMNWNWNQSRTNKQRTEQNDTFIICMIAQLGYGNWDELTTEIRRTCELLWHVWSKSVLIIYKEL